MRRQYKGNSLATTIGATVAPADVTLTVADGSTFPDATVGPFTITVNPGGGTEEKILVGARSGNTLSSLTRGYDGTSAQSHAVGETVRHTLAAVDLDEANAHLNSPSTHYSLTLLASAVGAVSGVIKRIAGQTADLLRVTDESNNLLANIDHNGAVVAYAGAATTTPLSVQAAPGQTADVFQTRDSSSVPHIRFRADGRIQFATTDASVSSHTASVGTAGTVPSQPNGWLAFVLDGPTVVYVPYWL